MMLAEVGGWRAYVCVREKRGGCVAMESRVRVYT